MHQAFLIAPIRFLFGLLFLFPFLFLWLLVLGLLALLARSWLRGSIAPIIWRIALALGLAALVLWLGSVAHRAAISCRTL
ncbi:hypothetical protein [Microbulbifer zhoushanensis]|uniref:hypothetical protein n=1 Tax=Microbulbifer zhoushanensis TaxID=2904254 RepID=UPI001F273F03|nr:hypothetical protein [Microbulbifer zhoushanensis]